METHDHPRTPSMAIWDVVILIISIYAIFSLVALLLFELPVGVVTILEVLDFVVCAIFLFDFGMRLFRAESKREYMKWGWLDLLSSIPAIEPFRAMRIFRVIRIIRIIRSSRHIFATASSHRTGATLATGFLLGFFLILFGAIIILEVEQGQGGSIQSGEEALWWAFVTITTVGYGDLVPVTTVGRIVAVVLMSAGIGVFSTLAAFVASIFLSDTPFGEARRGEVVTMETVSDLVDEVRQLREENQRLHEKVDRALGDSTKGS